MTDSVGVANDGAVIKWYNVDYIIIHSPNSAVKECPVNSFEGACFADMLVMRWASSEAVDNNDGMSMFKAIHCDGIEEGNTAPYNMCDKAKMTGMAVEFNADTDG